MTTLPEAEKEIERADESLASAKLLLKSGLLADSLSRSYYAVLHAARAALLFKEIAVDSHEAAKRLFGLHLIKTGEISSAFGIIFRKEQDDRILADYDVSFEPERMRVEERCEEAERFIGAVKTIINRPIS